MGVVTTRRIDQLRAECDKAGIHYTDEDGRLELMDKLRASLGAFDSDMEIDPMKAFDAKKLIAWDAADPFVGIEQFLTDAWVAEPKLDGARLRLFMGLTGNTLNSGRRSVRTFAYTNRTENFPHLAGAVVSQLAGVILDGEILAPSGRIQTHTGLWTNSLLNASVALCNSNPLGSIQTQQRFGKARYHVFDVLSNIGGESVQHLPYTERRVLLEGIVLAIQQAYPDCEIHIVDQLPATRESITKAIADGYEGIMLKQKSGIYKPGKRGREWVKIKSFSTADAFVVGFNPGLNGNDGLVGSLDLAVYRDGHIVPVAQVGNLTHEMRVAISDEAGALKPEFYGTVIEWMCQGIGKNGRARHAHMVRLRPDKDREDCQWDQVEHMPAV